MAGNKEKILFCVQDYVGEGSQDSFEIMSIKFTISLIVDSMLAIKSYNFFPLKTFLRCFIVITSHQHERIDDGDGF